MILIYTCTPYIQFAQSIYLGLNFYYSFYCLLENKKENKENNNNKAGAERIKTCLFISKY